MYSLEIINALNQGPQRPESQEKRVEVFAGTYKRALLVYVAIKRTGLPARIFSSSDGKGAVTSVPEAQPIADEFKARGACILTPENIHTAEDCTLHEHEEAPRA